MATTIPPLQRPRRISLGALLAWAESSLCFFLPLATAAYLFDAPRDWSSALLWTLPVWLCVAADYFGPAERGAYRPPAPSWHLDARLAVLFALQLANVYLLLEAAARLRWATPADWAISIANIAAMRVLVGTSSCCTGIAVAHELVHRRDAPWPWLGRILLWTVCYDHFAVEHVGGHHRHAATPVDPATARRGESFRDFLPRSLAGQWLGAWRLENERLRGVAGWAWAIRHRVLQGAAAQALMLAAIGAGFGAVPLALFLYQAAVAVRLLEAVNYFQHWGLERSGRRFDAGDAWATDSWFTLQHFVGLARHAEHHCRGGEGRPGARSPRLPYGYFVMALLIRLDNRRYRRLVERELDRLHSQGQF